MEQTTTPHQKLRPLLLAKFSLKNLSTYRIFKKNHYRTLKKLKISKCCPDLYEKISSHYQGITALRKIFQTLKHVKKLDLAQLDLFPSAFYKPKIISFAKRMQHISKISLSDKLIPFDNSHGPSISWPKHAKRLISCNYYLNLSILRLSASFKPPKSTSIFPYIITHQPHLKDLTLHFNFDSTSFLSDSHLFYRYPSTLQRLSLHNINLKTPINISLSHLQNLKYIELLFHTQIQIEPLISVLQLLSQLSSTLEGLSLQWPDNLTPDLTPAFPALKALKSLTKLQLLPQNRGIKLFSTILEAFEDCLLKELVIKANIKSEVDLISIANFVTKMENLESFEFKGRCVKQFPNDASGIKKVLEAVNGLSHLKQLSFISEIPGKKDCVIDLNSILSRIFVKPVPLESFVLQIKPLTNANENLLKLIEALKPIAGGLKELEIFMGEFQLKEAESEVLFDFLGSLQKIRVLKLSGLSVLTKQFFIDLAKTIIRMPPCLKVLMIGEVKGEMARSVFVSVLKEILQKRGLKTFDCRISQELLRVLNKKEKDSCQINLIEIKKKNPSLKCLPRNLPIFVGKEILSADAWNR